MIIRKIRIKGTKRRSKRRQHNRKIKDNLSFLRRKNDTLLVEIICMQNQNQNKIQPTEDWQFISYYDKEFCLLPLTHFQVLKEKAPLDY